MGDGIAAATIGRCFPPSRRLKSCDSGFRRARAKKTDGGYLQDHTVGVTHRQEGGYWKQRLDLEKRDQTSFAWASFGSRKMLDRRRELPGIRTERARLETVLRQPLPGVKVPKGLPDAPKPRAVPHSRRASNEPKSKRTA